MTLWLQRGPWVASWQAEGSLKLTGSYLWWWWSSSWRPRGCQHQLWGAWSQLACRWWWWPGLEHLHRRKLQGGCRGLLFSTTGLPQGQTQTRDKLGDSLGSGDGGGWNFRTVGSSKFPPRT